MAMWREEWVMVLERRSRSRNSGGQIIDVVSEQGIFMMNGTKRYERSLQYIKSASRGVSNPGPQAQS